MPYTIPPCSSLVSSVHIFRHRATKKAEENLQTIHIGHAGVWGKTVCFVIVGRFSSCEQGQSCWMKPQAKILDCIKALLLAACLIIGHLTAVNELYVSQLSQHSSLNESSECVLLSELLYLHSLALLCHLLCQIKLIRIDQQDYK